MFVGYKEIKHAKGPNMFLCEFVIDNTLIVSNSLHVFTLRLPLFSLGAIFSFLR